MRLNRKAISGDVNLKEYSLLFSDGTYTHEIKQSAAEGLAGTDLRMGLDNANMSFIICPRSEIDTDFGQVIHNIHPCLWLYRDKWEYQVFTPTHNVATRPFAYIHQDKCMWYFQASLTAGDAFEMRLESGDGLTDADGQQSFKWIKFLITIIEKFKFK